MEIDSAKGKITALLVALDNSLRKPWGTDWVGASDRVLELQKLFGDQSPSMDKATLDKVQVDLRALEVTVHHKDIKSARQDLDDLEHTLKTKLGVIIGQSTL